MQDQTILRGPSEKTERGNVFDWIYKTNCWGSPESLSGTGSTRAETRGIVRQLPALLEQLQVSFLMDVCGDFNWQLEVIENTKSLKRYLGVDLVQQALDIAQKRLAETSQGCSTAIEFQRLDVVHDELPRADALLLRDVMGHLRTADNLILIENIRRAGIRWLIATTFPRYENSDIDTGHWRAVNLDAPPFEFDQPVAIIDEENPGVPGKSLGVWHLN